MIPTIKFPLDYIEWFNNQDTPISLDIMGDDIIVVDYIQQIDAYIYLIDRIKETKTEKELKKMIKEIEKELKTIKNRIV